MIAGIYLAAGAGSRMNGPKLAAELLPGVPLGAYALRTLLTAGLDVVYAIVRPGAEFDWLSRNTADKLWKAGAASQQRGTPLETVVCNDAERGDGPFAPLRHRPGGGYRAGGCDRDARRPAVRHGGDGARLDRLLAGESRERLCGRRNGRRDDASRAAGPLDILANP
ncbi:NTP transferase domain-containing protein [Cohnella rhizosphaerae]|uniref:NTP transferase domain-containing protein n=1 Tax=Cohnella rhizosphaerae TaxID=1457232 RepID=A0A9X4KX28_9BACL|nr:NTP transferase domain-containing protein [Cohnella rhizosphaerae]MDG0812775.1 NTP transferase domain-containing protein [Cohnella rhizosphaerae]